MKTITPTDLFLKITESWSNPILKEDYVKQRKYCIKMIQSAKTDWENEAILRSMDEHLEDIL